MKERINHIEWSVVRPDRVTADRVNPRRECFYLEHTMTSGLRLWIKTVVHFDESVHAQFSVDGFIVTSFLTGRINAKEASLWP
jgi:hypothetical protein